MILTKQKANLKTVLFHQHVTTGFKASPLPHLGQSDHISLFLTPAYRPIISTVKPTARAIQVWPEGASEPLQISVHRLDHIWGWQQWHLHFLCTVLHKMPHGQCHHHKTDLRDAKAAYRRRIEHHFGNSDPCRARQRTRHITSTCSLATLRWKEQGLTSILLQPPTTRHSSSSQQMWPAHSVKSTHGKQLAQMSSLGGSPETVLQS